MPSQFEQSAAFNVDALYGNFGLAATYTAPGGAVTSGITVRRKLGEVRQVPRPNKASGELQMGDIMVRPSDVAKPVKNGRFQVESVEVWTIETTPILKNGEYHCTCSRSGVEGLLERRAKDNG